MWILCNTQLYCNTTEIFVGSALRASILRVIDQGWLGFESWIGQGWLLCYTIECSLTLNVLFCVSHPSWWPVFHNHNFTGLGQIHCGSRIAQYYLQQSYSQVWECDCGLHLFVVMKVLMQTYPVCLSHSLLQPPLTWKAVPVN